MSKHVPVGGSLDGWMQHIWAQARLRRGLVHAAGALSAFTPVLALAFANPTGGQVVAGQAYIQRVRTTGGLLLPDLKYVDQLT